MDLRGALRFSWWKLVLAFALLALVAVAAWWLAWSGRPSFGQDAGAVGTAAMRYGDELSDHAARAEALLRLQLLAAEMDRGRRASALRPGLVRAEEILEGIGGGEAGSESGELLTQMDTLLLELSDERRLARERLGSLIRSLLPSAGPGRQG